MPCAYILGQYKTWKTRGNRGSYLTRAMLFAEDQRIQPHTCTRLLDYIGGMLSLANLPLPDES